MEIYEILIVMIITIVVEDMRDVLKNQIDIFVQLSDEQQ
jgi:hypothetical protein